MKRIFLTLLLPIIISTPWVVQANNICIKLKGNWQGEWMDDKHVFYQANIQIKYQSANYFSGNFTLSNGSKGEIQGKCLAVNFNEAYLRLKKEAPLYNPCRGAIIQDNKKLNIQFYCFNPNQWGYFGVQ